MAKPETINLEGISGELYTFNLYGIGQVFKPLGSLYCITKRTASGSHQVLYVGQTEDLATRFNNHHKEDAWTKKGATNISIHLDEGKFSRLKKEADIVNHYKPSCNG